LDLKSGAKNVRAPLTYDLGQIGEAGSIGMAAFHIYKVQNGIERHKKIKYDYSWIIKRLNRI